MAILVPNNLKQFDRMSDNTKKLFSEDWLAVWIGAIVILIGCVAVLTGWFDFAALKFSTWHFGDHTIWAQLGKWAFWGKLLLTMAVLGLLFAAGIKLQGGSIKKFLPAFICLFLLAVFVRLISAEFTLNRYLEWAFWALIVGE